MSSGRDSTLCCATVDNNSRASTTSPVMASAAKCTVVQVRETVELGTLDPEAVVTPGIFVKRVVKIAAPLQEAA